MKASVLPSGDQRGARSLPVVGAACQVSPMARSASQIWMADLVVVQGRGGDRVRHQAPSGESCGSLDDRHGDEVFDA